eukprot:2489577-Amphidinium_carterae.1
MLDRDGELQHGCHEACRSKSARVETVTPQRRQARDKSIMHNAKTDKGAKRHTSQHGYIPCNRRAKCVTLA